MHGARLHYGVIAVIGVVGALAACGSAADSPTGTNAGPPGNGVGGSGTLPPDGQGEEPGPEEEQEPTFRAPVVSGHRIWTANPLSGRVALIDARTFTVKTALAGAGPTYLTALPAADGASRALVINTQSEDATLLAADVEGEVTVLATVPVHADANSWAVTSDGRFAVAWTNASMVPGADASEGFQDITVVDLSGDEVSSKRLSVGYRPARVFIDDDDAHVYVVTDSGVDVVALGTADASAVEREVLVSADPANDTAPREVNVTPSGDYAFVRREGKSYVTAVRLSDGALVDVMLPGPVSDLDLSADGALAVAAIRAVVAPTIDGSMGPTELANGGAGGDDAAGEGGNDAAAGAPGSGGAGGSGGTPVPSGASVLALVPVATVFAQPELFEVVELDQAFGSVVLGNGGETALLFANGVPSTRLTLLGLEGGSAGPSRTVDLKLPVFSASASPDGAHAVALLQPPAGSKQPGAFAVVPIAKNLPPKIQGTLAPTVPSGEGSKALPAMLAVGDERALLTVTNGADASVSYVIRFPQLTVDAFTLDSVPLPGASGLVVEANQAFVAQQHPEGRITFIDLETKEQHTLTGFELATKVTP
jgi:hypothetical protein